MIDMVYSSALTAYRIVCSHTAARHATPPMQQTMPTSHGIAH